MRALMPSVAAFIDDMRQAFGVKEIDDVIRRGLRADCQPAQRFFAFEAGHTLGQRYVPSGMAVSVAAMHIEVAVTAPATVPATVSKKRGRKR